MSLTSLRETWNGIDARGQLTLGVSVLGIVAVSFLLYTYA